MTKRKPIHDKLPNIPVVRILASIGVLVFGSFGVLLISLWAWVKFIRWCVETDLFR